MLLDVNRLKFFYYIYSQNSIVAAARSLHLTPPAVSQQLQKLEAEIQATLFVRLHKKLVPTEAAKRLFALVQPFMDSLQEEIENVRLPLDRPAGLLRIGAPREFGKEYLPPLSNSFRQKYPEVRFSFWFDETAPLLDMLKNGDLDFVLVDVLTPKSPFLDTPHMFNIAPLINEELILACSQSYYQKEIRGDHSFASLSTKEYISDEDELMILNYWYRHHFKKAVTKLNVIMSTNSHESLISGIRLGMGLGMTSVHFVYEELINGTIISIDTAKKNVKCWISLVQLQDKVPTLAEKIFITHLKCGMQDAEILKRFAKIK